MIAASFEPNPEFILPLLAADHVAFNIAYIPGTGFHWELVQTEHAFGNCDSYTEAVGAMAVAACQHFPRSMFALWHAMEPTGAIQ